MLGMDRRHIALALAMFGIGVAVACSASDTDPFGTGTSGSGGSAGTAGTGGTGGSTAGTGGDGDAAVVFDTGFTGDGQINADTSCADLTLQAEAVPLDMYFMLDVSGSMSGTNISALRDGLSNFFQDPQSAGLGAAAQMFPIAKYSDPYDETCDQNAYAKPAVPWGVLPNPSLVGWVQSLTPNGYTPSIPALTGAVQACHDRTTVMPTHKCAVVFVTDGRPEGNCPPTNLAAEAPLGVVAENAFNAGIPVFAIGFPGLDTIGQSVLNTIAVKGGTGTPVIIQGGNVGQAFIDALEDIRGTALGCEYQMPTAEAGTVNPNLVKVTYKPGGATEAEEVSRMDSAADCVGDGWYYDDNASPSKLIMCPSTCEKMQNDEGGEVQILLGCTDNQR